MRTREVFNEGNNDVEARRFPISRRALSESIVVDVLGEEKENVLENNEGREREKGKESRNRL